ncbi:hypothetical protein QYM36_007309 [Artemia franciscana]|uniref:Uncharacterized protein n=1 Tax=Artemia franciscana TaxID=6661 RepID=A0AA88HWI7_ARTSF|nr:hypothetical protein QYM36_007309 [Artemia franciscana]
MFDSRYVCKIHETSILTPFIPSLVKGEENHKVSSLFQPLSDDLNIPEFRIRQEDTRAVVRVDVDAVLIDGLDLIIEPIRRPLKGLELGKPIVNSTDE